MNWLEECDNFRKHGHEEKSINEISTSDINQTTVKDIDLSSVSKLFSLFV